MFGILLFYFTVFIGAKTLWQVVRVVVLTLRNLLSKGTFGAQMVDLGLPQIVQSLKAQAWSDEVKELECCDLFLLCYFTY